MYLAKKLYWLALAITSYLYVSHSRFVTGIEFRESSLTINPKNTMTIQKGMVFSVHVGFAELSNPSAEDAAGRTYALFIGDTVLAGEAGPGVELTAMSKKKISSIAIFMGVRTIIIYYSPKNFAGQNFANPWQLPLIFSCLSFFFDRQKKRKAMDKPFL